MDTLVSGKKIKRMARGSTSTPTARSTRATG